jgi:hypothetical protein
MQCATSQALGHAGYASSSAAALRAPPPYLSQREQLPRYGCCFSVAVAFGSMRARALSRPGILDWLAFSVDASSDDMHAALGRGTAAETGHRAQRHGTANAHACAPEPTMPGHAATRAPLPRAACRHLARVRELWPLARELGFRLKLNTVVTRDNLHDAGAPRAAGPLCSLLLMQLRGVLRPACRRSPTWARRPGCAVGTSTQGM